MRISAGVKLGPDAGQSLGSFPDVFCVLQPSVYPWGAATGIHDDIGTEVEAVG